MKSFLFIVLVATSLFAKTDYSEMSTEELLAMIGYVPKNSQTKFYQELKSRVPTMSKKEKKIYIQSLKKLKK